MSIRNLVVGFALLVAAQAAAFGASYSCTTSTGVSLTYTEVATGQPPIPPPATPPPPVTGDPGSGLWMPTGTVNRVVADPSGPSTNRIVSYIPGCLNGGLANNSQTGCAANNNYNGVKIVSGQTLMIRYRTKANAGLSDSKYLNLTSDTGGAVGPGVRIWLSNNPTGTYESTPVNCRSNISSMPFVGTGPSSCQVTSGNTYYYLGIETDSTTPRRFKVVDGNQTSDFY